MMSISASLRRLGLAVVGGVAAVAFSLATPAFANHGERHASEQGQQASAANAQSGDHAQNDEAEARRDAAPARGDGGGGGGDGGGGPQAGSNGDTQGASPSNPDGGGIDKPECGTAGNLPCQGSSDFDGNNGCGNDADREDDNNGNCGGPKKPKDCPPNNAANNGRGVDNANPRSRIRECGGTPPFTLANPPANNEVNPATGTTPTVTNVVDTGNVLSSEINRSEAVNAATTEASGATVLGVSFERSAAAAPAAAAAPKAEVLGVQFERGALARTGLGVALLVLVGLGLIGAGTGLKRFARRP